VNPADATTLGSALPLGPSGAVDGRGPGEMARRIRAMSWRETPLGVPETWPQELRTALSVCLSSRFPMIVCWGPELRILYNDAYLPHLGKKHPGVLGRPVRECYPEIWPTLAPLLGRVAAGEGTLSEDVLLALDRNVPAEEAYFTFSASPLFSRDGRVSGLLAVCTETTDRIVRERRLRALGELGAGAVEARSARHACELAASALARVPADVPFALLYLLDDAGETATLAGAAGLAAGSPCAPVALALGARGRAARWPVAVVCRSGAARLADVPARAARAAASPGERARWVERALVLPLAASAQDRAAGALVAGVSPRRVLDAEYREFLVLVAGQIAAGIAAARARDEERRRAAALAELDRAKTAFFADASHELRTPLTLVLGPVERALAAERPRLEGAELRAVHRNALRLSRLVNALLDFSRLEAGRMTASFEPTDVSALTADAASSFRSLVERAGLAFEVRCPPIPGDVFLDRAMWEKIVLNLVANAFKFTFEGRIRVELRDAGDRLELAVEDSGTGIAPDELPRVFERFHRVQGARARSDEGAGIGLALVRELAQLHGGTVDVASAPGAGAAFRVRIPKGRAHLPPEQVRPAGGGGPAAGAAAAFVAEAALWVDAGAAASAPHRYGREAAEAEARVLVADDNADMRAYLRRLLAPRFAVEEARTGAEALVAARARAPDLVLADVMMPELDGIALLRALRAHPSTLTLPVILVSGRAGEQATVEALRAGATDYLTKPFSAGELVARVEGNLRLARTLTDLDAFAGRVAHDLRNLLSPVGMVGALAQGAASRGERLATEKLVRLSRRATHVLEGLLAFSRAGRAARGAERASLAAVVRAAAEDLEALRALVDARVELSVDEGVDVDCPFGLAYVVVTNVLGNALKFLQGRAERRVRVAARARDGAAELAVEDSGPGIPEEALPRIFEPFYRVPGARAPGSGIGLATVHRIVMAHGGRVAVESRAGSGTAFRIALPLAQGSGR
jgi:signal transduction histidine kinase